MLRITRLSDYAVGLLTSMARREQEAYSARAAAEMTSLPFPAVSKILKRLAGHGLVVSHRGAQGGYRLGRQATQISLTDVIDAIEGPFALTQCSEGAGRVSSCEHEPYCGVRTAWSRVNGVVRRALASVTIADMAGDGPRALVPMRLGRAPISFVHQILPGHEIEHPSEEPANQATRVRRAGSGNERRDPPSVKRLLEREDPGVSRARRYKASAGSGSGVVIPPRHGRGISD